MILDVSKDDISWQTVAPRYIRPECLVEETPQTSASFEDYEFFKDVQTISMHNNAINILSKSRMFDSWGLDTDMITLSSESIMVRGNTKNETVSYLTNYGQPETIHSVLIDDRTEVATNFFLHFPLSDEVDNELHGNIINLKNTQSPDYTSYHQSLREYETFYFGPPQKGRTVLPVFGFSSEYRDYVFGADRATPFYLDAPLEFSSLTEHLIGARQGSSPENADLIYVSQYGYEEDTPYGPNADINGEPECLWYNDNNQWMVRWRLSDALPNQYFPTIPLTLCSPNYVDVPFDGTLPANVRIEYDRFGNTRNEKSILNWPNKILELRQWTLDITSNNTRYGQVYGVEALDSSELIMDGGVFGYMANQASLRTPDEMSCSVAVYREKWNKGTTQQFFGDYYQGGYGIFHDFGISSTLITAWNKENRLLHFNRNLVNLYNKKLRPGDDEADIGYVAYAADGTRWVYEKRENKILKIEIDDIIVNTIQLPSFSRATKLEVDRQNHLVVLLIQRNLFDNSETSYSYTYTENGVFMTSTLLDGGVDCFAINYNNNKVYRKARWMDSDTQNNIYLLSGNALYKNDSLLYRIKGTIHHCIIDDEDNIWILNNTLYITKINSDGFVVFNKQIPELSSRNETHYRMGIMGKIRNGEVMPYILILLGDNGVFGEMDMEGNIQFVHRVKDIFTDLNCDMLPLRLEGELTNHMFARKRPFSSASMNSPQITYQITLMDLNGDVECYSHSFPASDLFPGYHVFGMSFSAHAQRIRYFVDGELIQETFLEGPRKIYHNNVAPFVIGGLSAKLGTENSLFGLYDNAYFRGKIDNIFLLDRELHPTQMNQLADTTLKRFSDYHAVLPSITNYYPEFVKKWFLNREDVEISPYYDIQIRGLNISNQEVRDIVERAVREAVAKIQPVTQKLNELRYI
jgi:hypothetical protein